MISAMFLVIRMNGILAFSEWTNHGFSYLQPSDVEQKLQLKMLLELVGIELPGSK